MGEELAALEGRYKDMGSLADELGPSLEQIARVRELQAAYDEALNTQDFAAIADILSEMRSIAKEAGIEIDQGVHDKMVQAEDVARRFAAKVEDAGDAARDFASINIDASVWDAADAAQSLVDWLGKALTIADGLEGVNLSWIDRAGDGVSSLFGEWMAIADGMAAAKSLIMDKEGFRSNAYWDVNHYRAGYGSDTYTPADGKPRTVTQDTVVSYEDAERDLQRRVQEYFKTIIDEIGIGAFQALSGAQQGALASLLHNYGAGEFTQGGDLGGVVEALKIGNPNLVAQRIVERGGDNGGINRARRREEAAAFAPASGAIALDDAAIQAATEAEREQARAAQETAAANEQARSSYESLLASIDPVAAAAMRLEKAQETVNQALEANQITADEAAAAHARLLEEYQETLATIGQVDVDIKTPFDDMRGGIESLTESLIRAGVEGQNLGDVLRSFLMDAAIRSAAQSLTDALGGLFSGGSSSGGIFGSLLGAVFGGSSVTASAKGNVFQGGSITPFATGGVVSSPTLFPMSNGTGLMGEAGPEAIMPLLRTGDGSLGVKSVGNKSSSTQHRSPHARG